MDFFSDHYLLESAFWNERYLQSLYIGGRIELWREDGPRPCFNISLGLPRDTAFPEGELEVALNYRDRILHRLTFTWLINETSTAPSLIIGESKGLPRSLGNTDPQIAEAFAAFTQHVRFVSMRFFCFAALQGIARTTGCTEVYGVRASEQLSAVEDRSFDVYERAYDDFWRALGGKDDEDIGFRIELPVRTKLSHTPKEKRKIWAYWDEIEASTIDRMKAFRIESAGDYTAPKRILNSTE